MTLISSAATHPGRKRSRNEDRLVARPDLGLWAVADGAGGHGAGDVASAAIADALMAIPPGLSAAEMLAQLRLRLSAVNAELRHRALDRGGIIASTVVVLLLRGDHYAALWAGDSRIYLLRQGAQRGRQPARCQATKHKLKCQMKFASGLLRGLVFFLSVLVESVSSR